MARANSDQERDSALADGCREALPRKRPNRLDLLTTNESPPTGAPPSLQP